jgi:AbrB family looped-hinge helix DNA binding protein
MGYVCCSVEPRSTYELARMVMLLHGINPDKKASKTLLAGNRDGGANSRTIPTLVSIRQSQYATPIDMNTVTLSPKFEVVIPQAIREALQLTAGEKLRVLRYAGRIEFIPVRPIQQMRGFLRGMDTTLEREGDRL